MPRPALCRRRPPGGLVEAARSALAAGGGLLNLLDRQPAAGPLDSTAVQGALQLAMECVHQRVQMR